MKTNYHIYLLLGIILIFPLGLSAQFEGSYMPIKFEGPIPEDILQRTEAKTLSEISQNEGDLSENEAREFFTISNYALRQAFLTGNVFFNDEISEYLNNIVDHLLFQEPELRSQIKVYATRFSTPNAACWRNGTIFFNISLFPYLDNEAEVAYVLAHEITHFKKKHSLQQFKRSSRRQAGLFAKGQELDRLFEELKFSRSNELEADLAGLELLKGSAFDIRAAEGALLSLREIDVRPSKEPTLDLRALFGVENLKIDSADIVTYEELEEELEEELKKRDKEKEGEKKEKSKKEDSKYKDEDFATHPSIEDRLNAIKEELSSPDMKIDTTGKLLFLQGEDRFRYMRDLTRFENIKKYYENYRYAHCLYLSLLMLKKYPDNSFLTLMAMKSFYWISYHGKHYVKNDIIPDAYRYSKYSFGLFLGYMEKSSSLDVRKMANQYSKAKMENEAFAKNDKIIFWRAKILEINREEEEAEELFQKIADQYPQSDYYLHVKNLLEKE
ncbi:MAG: M48 family metallopeptidase [Bacteroidia bacterium]|nr:M48 family metallopeptidase [Bacteroidia bacterium]